MKEVTKFGLIVFVSFSYFIVCNAKDFWMKTNFTDETFDVFCPNNDEVFIVYNWDTYISQNMGKSWEKFLDSRLIHINKTSDKIYFDRYGGTIFVLDRSTGVIDSLASVSAGRIYEVNDSFIMRGYSKVSKSNLEWSNIYTIFDEGHGGEELTCFSVDSAGTHYLGSTDFMNIDDPGGVYKSYDNGETWTYPDLPNHFVRAMAVDSEGRIFVGTAGHYFNYTGQIYRSEDNGNSWQLVANGVYVLSMAINSEDEIFVGLDQDYAGYPCVLNSHDHGTTWESLEGGYPGGDVYDLAITPDGYVYLATRTGVYRSYKPTTALQTQFIEVNNSVSKLDVFGLKGSLDIELKNIGVLPSENVSLKATTKSKFITISDSTEFYGNLAQGDSLEIINCISYTVSTAISDQASVRIDIEISDSSGQVYNDYIDIVIDNPLVKFSHSIDGSVAIYPGDIREITFKVNNSSTASINSVLTELIQTGGYGISISEPVSVSSIPSSSSADIVYTCGFSNLTPIPQDIGMRLNFSSAEGIETFYDFMLRIGMTEDFETGDLSMNDWRLVGDSYWTIDDSVSYEGKYSFRSGDLEKKQSTRAYLDLNFLEDGYVSFYKKVSCPSSDELVFVVDYRVAEWSGVIDWSYEIFPVSAGEHRIEWWYRRSSFDYSVVSRAWIDNILITGIATGIESNETIVNDFKLYQNYPNPFNSETTISYLLGENAFVEVNLYNIKGEFVENLLRSNKDRGKHKITFYADRLNTGVYFFRMSVNGKPVSVKKMLYLK